MLSTAARATVATLHHRGHLFASWPPRRYYTRAELACCNLHFPPLAGIDWVAGSNKQLFQLSRGITFATSIMVSGCYADDHDRGDELWYTGVCTSIFP